MAKVFMICGKLCSGKSTYAAGLRDTYGAVILSVDQIMLALFGQHAGDKHDDYVKSTKKYLLDKSLEILQAGADVVLDWGFWTKEERRQTGEFFSSRNVEYEFHYIDVSPGEWRRRLDKRNREIAAGKNDAYYVDENLAAKFDSLFEQPERAEMDVWVESIKDEYEER